MPFRREEDDRVVITGIGMVTSLGATREAVWDAVQQGKSGVRVLTGIPRIPDGMMLGAVADIPPEYPERLKTIRLCEMAAREALGDSHGAQDSISQDRFGCAISGHMGDIDQWTLDHMGRHELIDPNLAPWTRQWLPNTACVEVATKFGLYGPRLSHSTACSSGLIEILSAVRAIRDGQCDAALAGSGEAIHPIFAAGFHKMRVLAWDDIPQQACRPFDVDRKGFVMGEGSAMFVLERLSTAQRRGAKIYAEILGGQILADAHHVTGLDAESSSLERLISNTLERSKLAPGDIAYINAHGTGTEQNDVMETRGIRRALGAAADRVSVSSVKAMLGHLVNAAGSVELAITTLALRDGFAPPTINLTHQDPDCDLDCIPLVGRPHRFDHALKTSVAFGGHLAAVALRRWNDPKSGFEYPTERRAA